MSQSSTDRSINHLRLRLEERRRTGDVKDAAVAEHLLKQLELMRTELADA